VVRVCSDGIRANNPGLGRGEKEAIKLCKQVNASFFIADDREARRAVRVLNIRTVGTCGTVIQAHRMGFYSKREAIQIIDGLI
jgi:predicted nucleic acid-binding protein